LTPWKNSNWSSPLHMVKKADRTWRPCSDFRRLNLQMTEDRYTCSNIGDLTARLAGCRVFSKLDLRKGSHQVPVNPAHISKTAVVIPFGLYEFLRMPFGLRNAGQTFQRLMDDVMAGLPFCFVYLDDVLVASAGSPETTWAGHKRREMSIWRLRDQLPGASHHCYWHYTAPGQADHHSPPPPAQDSGAAANIPGTHQLLQEIFQRCSSSAAAAD
jgi:Reverse transcriptase (RNA-dependent DNA polymerase)